VICVTSVACRSLPGPSRWGHCAWSAVDQREQFCYEVHEAGAALVLLAGLGRDVPEMNMLAGSCTAALYNCGTHA
jgi:hypothetical protein